VFFCFILHSGSEYRKNNEEWHSVLYVKGFTQRGKIYYAIRCGKFAFNGRLSINTVFAGDFKLRLKLSVFKG